MWPALTLVFRCQYLQQNMTVSPLMSSLSEKTLTEILELGYWVYLLTPPEDERAKEYRRILQLLLDCIPNVSLRDKCDRCTLSSENDSSSCNICRKGPDRPVLPL
eukprot:TRINITY_DN2054_c0_g1::TRINITY_DN2054_c0_g1_i1::g.21814::m.21814 TRINITY_DN2054_c0_g1::TRINITY_DN2054_c0_g1_i1::g.21814  ORF type:complete len:105 (+),score=8.64,Ric8/PF10165.4/0.047 TRINITY_DN2054_c0_g1_i1:423-737(+)